MSSFDSVFCVSSIGRFCEIPAPRALFGVCRRFRPWSGGRTLVRRREASWASVPRWAIELRSVAQPGSWVRRGGAVPHNARPVGDRQKPVPTKAGEAARLRLLYSQSPKGRAPVGSRDNIAKEAPLPQEGVPFAP